MKQISVLLSILAVILVVILSSAGAQDSLTYMGQSVFQGQSVRVDGLEEAYVNDEPAQVIHTGMVFANTFQVKDVLLLNSMNTMVVDHSTGGSLGTPTYIFTNISSRVQDLGVDVELDDWEISYNTTFEQADGTMMYVYKYDNLSVAVSQTDYSIIEDDGRYLLLQQSGANLAVAEIEQPFAMSYTEIVSLALILAVIGIVAYWYGKGSKDWKKVRK